MRDKKAMVFFLLFTVDVTPRTNFIVPDLWRWLAAHMWAEVTYEIFIAVIGA